MEGIIEIAVDINSLVEVDKHRRLSINVGDISGIGQSRPTSTITKHTSSAHHRFVQCRTLVYTGEIVDIFAAGAVSAV